MQASLVNLIERLKIAELKALIDIIRNNVNELTLTKQNIEDIYEKLNEKVNLTSRMMEGGTTYNTLGSGVISISGSNATGTGTLFTKECAIGNQIKVGTETQQIETILSDTSLTFIDPFVNTYTNNVYAIIKNATQEVLTGDYSFGELNGYPFRGIIKQGSSFEHYGRISEPYDLVNVKFLQRAVNPAMSRAQNAIQRDGDTIGLQGTNVLDADKLNYLFRNTKMVFDSTADLKYLGPITDEEHLITLGYLSDYIGSYANQDFYARWSGPKTSFTVTSAFGYNWVSPFSKAPDENTSNFADYFEITNQGLKAKKKCKVFITIDAYSDFTNAASSSGSAGIGLFGIIGNVTKNKILTQSYNHHSHSDQHGSSAAVPISCSTVVNCDINDIIICGSRLVARDSGITTYCSMTLMR